MSVTVKMNFGDTARINTRQEEIYIDVDTIGYEEGLAVETLPGCSPEFKNTKYVELREKEGRIRLFFFEKRSTKKQINFGWWDDAKIVYSKNFSGGYDAN